MGCRQAVSRTECLFLAFNCGLTIVRYVKNLVDTSAKHSAWHLSFSPRADRVFRPAGIDQTRSKLLRWVTGTEVNDSGHLIFFSFSSLGRCHRCCSCIGTKDEVDGNNNNNDDDVAHTIGLFIFSKSPERRTVGRP